MKGDLLAVGSVALLYTGYRWKRLGNAFESSDRVFMSQQESVAAIKGMVAAKPGRGSLFALYEGRVDRWTLDPVHVVVKNAGA